MYTIHKYPLPIEEECVIKMPAGAEMLSVGVQKGMPYVWALVWVDDMNMNKVKFRVIGTGNPTPEGMDEFAFLGTFMMYDGEFVGHVFVEKAYKAE